MPDQRSRKRSKPLEAESQAPDGTCVCGANAGDHQGECHFGWHNPLTCPDRAVGVLMGRFCPPHRGHRYLIETAAANAADLYVLVIGNKADERILPLALRARWLAGMFGSDHVHVVAAACPIPPSGGNPQIISALCSLIQSCVGDPAERPIGRFFSGERGTYGDWTAAAIGADHICIDPERIHVPISATAVRADPSAAAEFLDEPVKDYLAASKPEQAAMARDATIWLAAQPSRMVLSVGYVREQGRLDLASGPGRDVAALTNQSGPAWQSQVWDCRPQDPLSP